MKACKYCREAEDYADDYDKQAVAIVEKNIPFDFVLKTKVSFSLGIFPQNMLYLHVMPDNVSGNYVFQKKINYCPMCGRRLGK